ncbi:MAG: 23S rRNA pseudouridine(955/2504/2580) synthase RluC [Gammaproteobacteria bacterium]|nr:23S rRNA pseudouridine(955/2504/2580) synthase RluC [Gammaproteobacteria bacterium]MBU1554729.1 23S rRNA pseudouridine(955/2504/2580) synthase RluC [Gammaproteobacteria bacterium]MBU2070126.1 23S rRNA pseudouridine(955/2504/2580) synthase RluC [Gammaproteobacteria bacterium]MBU2183122.1 23S rRNA pseudouridine(955/2504/2580) synthase RluC [Gammaproteobacteria bacterium]MBU2205429.1 23S rRNA pseudouridine(955/2504/2580) synthase RluC [Gammaproteobacteria bacterium]
MSDEIKLPIQMIEIEPDFIGQRIDNFLLARLKGVPKSVIYRVLRKGEVRVNKKRIKPEYKLQADDVVRIPPITVTAAAEPISVKLSMVKNLEQHILFEDNDLIVLNKPSGMAVHGGSGLQFGVIEALRALRPLAKHLELVHRLDRDTSGCLLIAKKRSVLTHLHEQLRNKTVEKKYWALVAGDWDNKVRKVTEPLKKNTLQSGERVVRVDEKEGKPSETRFRILQRYQQGTLVEAFPVTGRTHQIRVHTACKGHPIACDDKYGDNTFTAQMQQVGLNRLFLHAKTLSFMHPMTETTMRVEAPLDPVLEQALTKLTRK